MEQEQVSNTLCVLPPQLHLLPTRNPLRADFSFLFLDKRQELCKEENLFSEKNCCVQLRPCYRTDRDPGAWQPARAGGLAQEDPGSEAPHSQVVLLGTPDPRGERCYGETGLAFWLPVTDVIAHGSTCPHPGPAFPLSSRVY